MRTVNCKNLAVLAVGIGLAFGCQKSQYQVTDPAGGANTFKTGTTDLGNGCYLSTFAQPKQDISHKVDLLFVPDTSRSVFKEREAAADGISHFIDALPKEVDFRAAVVLAHGSTSPYTGKLYSSPQNEPAVLSPATNSLDQIRTGLKAKLTPLHGDKGSDGGEMGMYSLLQTMTTANLRQIRAAGFYRADAALAVIFIADENDICAVYPQGVTPVPDPNHQEPIAKKRDCKDVTAERVFNNLRKMKGQQPITIAGIVYTPESKINNKDSSDEWAVENEIGYGYLDLIRLSNGLAIDLSAGKIAEGLSSIGKLTALKLALQLEFPLEKGMKVKPDSVEVKIDGQPIDDFRYEPATSEVHLGEGGKPGSRVDVKYCQQ